MEPVTLFVFGAGYSARAAIAAIRAERPEAGIAATTRSADNAPTLAAMGVTPIVFDGEAGTPALAAALGRATHLLVSIAPGPSGDPVLALYRDVIARIPDLRWIGYYSTIGVYGDADGGWIDEIAPLEATVPRLARRIEAEAGWRRLAGELSVPLAILRLAGIYGPGRSAIDKVREGTARRLVKPGQVFNRVHVNDIAAITARALARRLDGVYNVADGNPGPPQDVIAHAAKLLGVEPPPEIAFDAADLSPMARSFYANNRKVSNDAIRRALGYRFAYGDYRAGLAAILEDERARPNGD